MGRRTRAREARRLRGRGREPLVAAARDGRHAGRRAGNEQRRHRAQADRAGARGTGRTADPRAGAGTQPHRPRAARSHQPDARRADHQDGSAARRRGDAAGRRRRPRRAAAEHDGESPTKFTASLIACTRRRSITSASFPRCSRLVNEFSTRHGIAIEFAHGPVPAPLPSEVALCLFRVTEESLTNIAKHSQAAVGAGARARRPRRHPSDGRGYGPRLRSRQPRTPGRPRVREHARAPPRRARNSPHRVRAVARHEDRRVGAGGKSRTRRGHRASAGTAPGHRVSSNVSSA